MKRSIATLLILAGIIAMPLCAQVRIDVGFDLPRGVGAIVSGQPEISSEISDALSKYIIPFPEAGLYYQYQFSGAPVRIGGGVRLFTFIIESIVWPNIFVEADVWQFTFSLQTGGGVFGMFGVYGDFRTAQVVIPDLSVWFRIGDAFRIGGGAIAFASPDIPDGIAFVYYLGLKFAIKF